MATEHVRRDVIISFRVTSLEAAHLDSAGKAMTRPRQRADFARAAALHAAKARVPEPARGVRRPGRRKPAYDIELLAKILAQLAGVGRSLEQLQLVGIDKSASWSRLIADLTMDFIEIRNAVRAALDNDHSKPEHGGADGHQG